MIRVLHRPGSLEEALELIGCRENRRVYAGGTELLLLVKLGLAQVRELVDLKRLGLDGIARDGTVVIVGACATHAAIARSRPVRAFIPVLAATAGELGNVRVRATGTIGGNLCFADPSSDVGCVLLLEDAEVELRSRRGTRRVEIGRFFVHAFSTVLADDELLVAVRVPVPSRTRRRVTRYRRIALGERPTAGAGVSLELDAGGRIVRARVAVGAGNPHPIRIDEAEAHLQGQDLATAREGAEDVGRLAATACEPIGDVHASPGYKRHLVGVMARRALEDVVVELEATRG
ncbi:MAG TPA: FAD binding domain-containing protein [Candidatus Dormibacteraeota bacterium]|jgi:carbon-monoxide dehydrogenase medium subunit|nr:FAD binding domain-containing protein [Candidatus Dormibacteraeota bacterium]